MNPIKHFTKKQWILISVIIMLSMIDTGITLYGAWYHADTFYEANPLFGIIGLTQSIEIFTVGLIAIKIVGISSVIYIISLCNNIGEDWGNAVCYGCNIACAGLISTMVILNVWVNYFGGSA